MNKHNFFYFIKEGAVNMFSHGFMSFASVGITVACLLIMGTFTLVAVNANAMLAELESQNQVLAFVEKGMSEAEARALEKEILAVDNVASATFISGAATRTTNCSSCPTTTSATAMPSTWWTSAT